MTGDTSNDQKHGLDRHVAGTTQRWTFDGGPTSGKTYEHVFHLDGTVEFREVKAGQESSPQKPAGDAKRPRYGVAHIAPGIRAVSYLSAHGYTLTVVLNDADHKLHGFASSGEEWHQVSGTFELVE